MKKQRNYSQLFAILKKNRLEKADVVSEFTEGRTDSLTQLSDGELKELMIRLQRHNPMTTDDTANKMRRKMIAIARSMRWTKPNPNPLKRYDDVADMERLDNWCIKYGKYSKKLNDHSVEELGLLVTAFEKVQQSFLGGLQKTLTNLTMRTADSELIKERNQAIYQRYCHMYFTQMLREEAIWPVLRKEFWLETRTLYGIVLNVSKEAAAATNQLEIPLTPKPENEQQKV